MYLAVELCYLIRRMTEHLPTERLTISQVLQCPLFKWLGVEGMNQRIRWIHINQDDLQRASWDGLDLGSDRISGWTGWTSRIERPLPCTQVPVPIWANQSGRGLIDFICICAGQPDTSVLRLPDNPTSAAVYDALGCYFLRLFPNLFVDLFEALLKSTNACGDPWVLSTVEEVAPNAAPSATTSAAPICEGNFQRPSNPSGEDQAT